MSKDIAFHDFSSDRNATNSFNSQENMDEHKKKQRHIKRVLRFSDGDMEEYSSDDETESSVGQQQIYYIDPNTLNWLPWTWYKTMQAGSKVLEACDYVGEILADFLGITSPKYQFEIDEYNKMHAIENEIREKEDLEMAGWYTRKQDNLLQNNVISNQNNVGTHV